MTDCPRRDIVILFFLSLLISMGQTQAATYYLSEATGDDARTAAQAQSQSTPWKSPAKIQGLSLGAGDQVLFESGGTYRGTLILGQGAAVAGAVGDPVTIGAYGTGNAPILSGTQSVTGTWTRYQGNIWSIAVTGSVEQLFLDGHTLTLARHPNRGTVPITDVVSTNVFTSAALTGLNITGATVFARSQHWTWNMNVISQFNSGSGQITFSGTPIYPIRVGWGAWLNNHLSLLDSPGEWFWDSQSGRLYVWLPTSGDPNGRSLEVSQTGSGLTLNNVRQTVIQDLTLWAQGGDGVSGSGSDLILRRLRVENSLGAGIRLSGPRIAVEQSEVIGPNVYGMVISGDRNRIEGNTVKRVAEMARLTRTGLGGECCSGRGLNVSGADVTVRGNVLDSIGYLGIGFDGQRTLIENNFVRRFCMTTDDGAAVYTWSSDYALPGAAGSVIRSNLILDAIGAPDGIPDSSTFALGIYLDDRTHHIVIENNTVSGTDIGIFLHNTRDDTVRNNLSYGNRMGQLITRRDDIVGANDMYGSVVRDNILY
nr:right-handed parallel beta-helix repeat-containing protein [Fibrobacterota bacterium]